MEAVAPPGSVDMMLIWKARPEVRSVCKALPNSVEDIYSNKDVTLPIRCTETRRLNRLFRLVECWCPATGGEFGHFSFIPTATNPYLLVLLEVELGAFLKADTALATMRQMLQLPGIDRVGVVVLVTNEVARSGSEGSQSNACDHAATVNEQLRENNHVGVPLFITWNVHKLGDNMERAAKSMSDYCNTLPQSRVPGKFDWTDWPTPVCRLDVPSKVIAGSNPSAHYAETPPSGPLPTKLLVAKLCVIWLVANLRPE
jgi:hypothetical protein